MLIAIFKLLKALMLIALGIAALTSLHKDLPATVLHWAQVLRVDPDNRFLHSLLAKIFRVTPKQLKELSVGTFIYAAMFSIEGVGLLLRRRWAEYFTIITTTAFIPLEIYELSRRFTAVRLAILCVNVAIVVYLVRRVRK